MISLVTLLPLALFALTLFGLVRSFQPKMTYGWMALSLLFSGASSFFGIQEVSRSIRHERSVASRILCILAIFLGTVAAFFTSVAGLPPLDWNMKQMRVKSDIHLMRQQLLSYKEANGSYPSTEQGLQALARRFIDEIPSDSWGTPYVYRFPGKRDPNAYDLFSAGPDRIPDTADDDWGK